MYAINKYCYIIITFLCFLSCEKRNYLEEALKLSDENRTELEKVLNHYKNDTLKLRAAQFLIENMPGHHSYSNSNNDINQYYTEIDSVYESYKNCSYDSLIIIYEAISKKYDFSKIKTIPDLKCITSDYLIDNIERSFEIWENGEWSRHLDFDAFCEYILPYKVGEYQILDNWRTYSKDLCKKNIDTLRYCSLYKNLAVKACQTVNLELNKKLNPKIATGKSIMSVQKIDIAMRKPIGTCEDFAFIATALMRAKGIPVAMDYTPQWPFRSMGHSWNVILDNFGKNIVFLGCDSTFGILHKEDHPTAKVFRQTYAINREIEQLHKSGQYVPYTFMNYCIKDVTEEYMCPVDVKISLKQNTNSQYAYLAVFDNKHWVPIQFGKINKKEVLFKKMGKSIVYLPIIYERNSMVPIANPFIIHSNGKQEEIIPDQMNKQILVLDRKYPVLPKVFGVSKRILNGKIQSSNDSDFKKCITVHTINKMGPQYGEIQIDSIREKYQYWRYLSPERGYCNIAELYFFQKDSLNATYGKVLGTNGVRNDMQKHIKEVTFDNDPLTFNYAPISAGGWVGQDFGRPISINRIIYIPRGDGNGVIFGDDYELFYWDNNDWQSLGKKSTDGISLTFENCPTNALFLLHDHTKGKEERIFTYENDEQIWW
jgi:hypothetical protein